MSIVNLTEQAKQHMATMLKEHNKPAIRLGLKGGGVLIPNMSGVQRITLTKKTSRLR